jgi:hypothetical protein
LQVLQSLGLDAAWDERLAAAWRVLAGAPAESLAAHAALGAAQAGDDLVWLTEVIQARRPFAAVVHCLCAP